MNMKLGLSFEPQNRKFKEMMVGLQSLVKIKKSKLFFLDASAECEKRFSSSTGQLYGFIGTASILEVGYIHLKVRCLAR